MSVEVQAEADFDHARRRAFFGRVAARMRRECTRLVAFDEVKEGSLAHNRRGLGLRVVEVSTIVGSVVDPCSLQERSSGGCTEALVAEDVQ